MYLNFVYWLSSRSILRLDSKLPEGRDASWIHYRKVFESGTYKQSSECHSISTCTVQVIYKMTEQLNLQTLPSPLRAGQVLVFL